LRRVGRGKGKAGSPLENGGTMQHWRTTLAGSLLILGAAVNAAAQLAQGHPVDWVTVGGAVTGGIGLIKAADAKAV